MDRALELEPYFWVIQNLNAWIYYFEEKYDKAIEACTMAHSLNEDFIENNWLFFLNYAKLGEGEKAMTELQTIARTHPVSAKFTDEIEETFNKSGIEGLFSWLVNVNINKPVPVAGITGHPYFIAWWYAIPGNREKSIYWLEKNMETQSRYYEFFNLIATNPDFDILRSNTMATFTFKLDKRDIPVPDHGVNKIIVDGWIEYRTNVWHMVTDEIIITSDGMFKTVNFIKPGKE